MAEILQGIAAVLWPIIVIVLIVVLIALFKPSIGRIIDSAKSREFSIKAGNYELNMKEASEQQRKYITDIQNQVLELGSKVEHGNQSSSKLDIQLITEQLNKKIALLWVDDNPRNNSYYIQQLNDLKIHYDLETATSSGLRRFKQGQYTLVISDMGRREKSTAGLDLLKEIRVIDKDVPFIIFTTSENVLKYSPRAKELGATLITTSWTKIMGVLLKEYSKAI